MAKAAAEVVVAGTIMAMKKAKVTNMVIMAAVAVMVMAIMAVAVDTIKPFVV